MSEWNTQLDFELVKKKQLFFDFQNFYENWIFENS